MKVIARVGGRELELVVARDDDGYAVQVGGRAAPARVAGRGPIRTVILDGRAVETAAWRAAGGAADGARGATAWDIAAGGRVHAVLLVDPLRAAAVPDDTAAAGGILEVRAVMPGKVVAVLAAEGQDVQQGQGLLVVEAMKMENEITAPRAGKLIGLKVRQGEAVEAGALLATLE
jgi:biotin carboxyl carrier protein